MFGKEFLPSEILGMMDSHNHSNKCVCRDHFDIQKVIQHYERNNDDCQETMAEVMRIREAWKKEWEINNVRETKASRRQLI